MMIHSPRQPSGPFFACSIATDDLLSFPVADDRSVAERFRSAISIQIQRRCPHSRTCTTTRKDCDVCHSPAAWPRGIAGCAASRPLECRLKASTLTARRQLPLPGLPHQCCAGEECNRSPRAPTETQVTDIPACSLAAAAWFRRVNPPSYTLYTSCCGRCLI